MDSTIRSKTERKGLRILAGRREVGYAGHFEYLLRLLSFALLALLALVMNKALLGVADEIAEFAVASTAFLWHLFTSLFFDGTGVSKHFWLHAVFVSVFFRSFLFSSCQYLREGSYSFC